MRTYRREDWLASRELWDDFDNEWRKVRELAAQRGFIYPPSGTRHDDRDDAEPSQRAIVYRALQDNPTELLAIVGRSSSWSGVVDRIIALEARLREDANYRDKDAEYDRDGRPTHVESAQALKRILDRIGAS